MNAITQRKAITGGQKEQGATVIKDAARKAAEEAIAELEKNGALDGDNMQCILGKGDVVSARIKDVVKELLAELAENITGRLKLISGAETLTLDATDGKATISKAGNVFNGYLDSDFSWGCHVEGSPTGEQAVQVHEMIKDGTFEQIYAGMSDNLDAMCLSQSQIIQFVQKHRKWLRTKGYGTFFLFKVGKEFFVAYVGVNSDGSLWARVFRLSFDDVWGAGGRHRFVLPQLATQAE